MKSIALFLSVICIVSGLCGVIGALIDWNFYSNRHARSWMSQYGRNGTRIMIGFVGAVTLLVGLLVVIWCWAL